MLVEIGNDRLFVRVKELQKLLKHEHRGVILCDASGAELQPSCFRDEQGFNAHEIYAVVVPHKIYGRVEKYYIDQDGRLRCRIICTYLGGIAKRFENAYQTAYALSMYGRR